MDLRTLAKSRLEVNTETRRHGEKIRCSCCFPWLRASVLSRAFILPDLVRTMLASLLICLGVAAWSSAANVEHAAPGGEEHGAAGAVHAEPMPVPPVGARWAGVVVIVILALFLAAAVIGPIVRANAPEEIPPAHSHDEPPGASHHHGKSGTLNPEPEHDHH